MLIIAGHIEVDPDDRDEAVAVMRDLVTRARDIPGCLDLAATADLIDPGRVNIFERRESQEALETFRGSGPGNEQGAAMVSVSVAEYDVVDVRTLFGEDTD